MSGTLPGGHPSIHEPVGASMWPAVPRPRKCQMHQATSERYPLCLSRMPVLQLGTARTHPRLYPQPVPSLTTPTSQPRLPAQSCHQPSTQRNAHLGFGFNRGLSSGYLMTVDSHKSEKRKQGGVKERRKKKK